MPIAGVKRIGLKLICLIEFSRSLLWGNECACVSTELENADKKISVFRLIKAIARGAGHDDVVAVDVGIRGGQISI